MDFVVEFLGELILEGALMGATSRKVPVVVRVLLALILVVLFGGLVALLVCASIQTGSIVVWLCTAGVSALIICAAVKTVRKFRSEN